MGPVAGGGKSAAAAAAQKAAKAAQEKNFPRRTALGVIGCTALQMLDELWGNIIRFRKKGKRGTNKGLAYYRRPLHSFGQAHHENEWELCEE
jgi:hypothetical protein